MGIGRRKGGTVGFLLSQIVEVKGFYFWEDFDLESMRDIGEIEAKHFQNFVK
jgi:hypothetical protein